MHFLYLFQFHTAFFYLWNVILLHSSVVQFGIFLCVCVCTKNLVSRRGRQSQSRSKVLLSCEDGQEEKRGTICMLHSSFLINAWFHPQILGKCGIRYHRCGCRENLGIPNSVLSVPGGGWPANAIRGYYTCPSLYPPPDLDCVVMSEGHCSA